MAGSVQSRADRTALPDRLRTAWRSPTSRPVLVAVGLTTLLGLAYLAVPRMGGDLSAQMARADFARDHPLTPVDFRWFAGVLQFNYSLWTPVVQAVIGVKLTGAIATVISAGLLVRLYVRAGAPHATLAAVAAAVTLTTNLVEGRVTFTCGIACGLGALVAVAAPTTRRRVAAVVLAALCTAASPVAGLFLILCAGAMLLDRRIVDAVVVGVAAALPIGLTSLYFADAGRQTFGTPESVRAMIMSLLVAVLVNRRVVRYGALLGFVMVLLARVLTTPVGSNSIRLTTLFALPTLIAFLPVPRLLRTGPRMAAQLLVLVGLVYFIQPSLWFGTLGGIGRPATYPGYYAPLVAQLDARGVTGRVEVPELTGHWEAVYLARHVPLARGWLRQLDTKLNTDVTYQSRPPTAVEYRRLLDRMAVQYVAVSDSRPTYFGHNEERLIATHPDYLTEVWSNRHWHLYAVRNPTPVVSGPGRLTALTPTTLRFTVAAAGDVTIQLRWFRFLTLHGPLSGCLARRDDYSIVLRGAVPGAYTIGSALPSGTRSC